MTTMLEKMADAIQAQTDCQCRASVLAAARAALDAIRKPSIAAHNAGAFSDHQSRAPKIVLREDGLLAIEWRPANPSGLFTTMIDAILAEKDAA